MDMAKVDLSRISLRPFQLSDVDDFLLWAGDDNVTRHIRWKTCDSKEEALSFIRDVCIPHPWRRSICLDDRSIGFVSVYPWSGDDRCKADIGYAVAANYWGKGIATKALKIALSQVFQDFFPVLVRLQAFADVENKASQRVLEKAGFVREGVLRKYTYVKGIIKDLAVFSFLSTDEIAPGVWQKWGMLYIATKYWGQGICTEAVKDALSQQVFKDFPDLVSIQAFVAVENKASKRVLEKTGFLREGILRKYSYVKGSVKDVAIFSLLSEDAIITG